MYIGINDAMPPSSNLLVCGTLAAPTFEKPVNPPFILSVGFPSLEAPETPRASPISPILLKNISLFAFLTPSSKSSLSRSSIVLVDSI